MSRLPAGENRAVCKLFVRRSQQKPELCEVSEIISRIAGAVILGGNEAVGKAGGFSYWAYGARDEFRFCAGDSGLFEKLEEALGRYRLAEESKKDLPAGVFCGGWIGYFGYEVGRYIEKLGEAKRDDIDCPLVELKFYDKVICYDHMKEEFLLIALEIAGTFGQSADEKLDELEEVLEKAKRVTMAGLAQGDIARADFKDVRCNMTKEEYLEGVERIRRHILDGDVYQVNFTRRLECEFKGRAIDLYHWQNKFNPSGYAAFINGEDFSIVSASPEMFITLSGGVISTKPIKGTRARVEGDERLNAKNFAELAASDKEQAELNMIVDLERNDLARICKAGTRRVVQQRTIEEYPTVFHAVATVAGQIKEEALFGDILKAMFPGGSITGAPKKAAMEIIEELEPTARGIYTGSIGFIGIDGNACLNIAIRTIIIKGGKAYVQVGGGIVADSSAESEWQETIIKAKALIAGIKSA